MQLDLGRSVSFVHLMMWLSCKAYSKINRKVFAVYGSNDVVRPKDGLFGIRTMSDIILRKCAPQKTPKRGVNRHFQAKLAQY